MTEFLELLNNKLLFWSLFSCITAQALKIVFNFILAGEIRFGIIFETGGMPSSHSALITALTAGVGLDLGFDDPIFALAVGISLIVMYDASGVRRSAGLQAKEINKLSKNIDKSSSLKLKETLGHSKIEVVVGSILGPLISLPGIVFLGSPANIYNIIFN
tara:strand:+ start:1037 stop:1516 length:480 start_codon:yes stop_codon:yes gene_type:complete